MSEAPQLTDQQSAAISSAEPAIALSAGAGCGKTFVLAERFLAELAARNGDSSRLVAITFTERAAAEMRDRIRRGCRDRLHNCSEEQTPCWHRALREIDNARITTIHGFCGTLLRKFADEAGLEPDFSIVEAAAARLVQTRIARREFNQLLTAKDIGMMLAVQRLGIERAQQTLATLMEGPPISVPELSPMELVHRWRRNWNDVTAPRLARQVLESREFEAARDALANMETKDFTMRQRREEFFDLADRLRDVADPLPILAGLKEACRVQGARSGFRDSDEYPAIRDRLREFRDLLGRLVNLFENDDADLLPAAELSISLWHLAKRVRLSYRTEKRRQNVLDFDDLLYETLRLLEANPATRRRAVGDIDLLMVDEFQDTDATQAKIVALLAGEDDAGGRLFVVGDPRQSIYGFRGADPRVFERLRKRILKAGRLALSRNFRSQPQILSFVNEVFQDVEGFVEDALIPHREQQADNSVEMLFVTPEPNTNREQQLRAEAKQLAERIREMTTGPAAIARPGEIAVLFRALSHVGTFEEALRAAGIEYYLVGSKAFFAQQEVHDVAHLIQTVDDPEDEVALLGVLRSPFFSWADDTVLLMAQNEGSFGEAIFGPLPTAIDNQQAEQVRFAQQVLSFLRRNKDRYSPAELLETAVEMTGFDAALVLEFLGERKCANLRKLIARAREMERTSAIRFDLREFADWIRDSIQQNLDESVAATRADDENVVRLMTIHQAKGLEFPVVFVADCAWTPFTGFRQPVVDVTLGPLVSLPDVQGKSFPHLGVECRKIIERAQSDAEALRLFYVAMTRAADRLVLSAARDSSDPQHHPWLQLLKSDQVSA